MLVLSCFNLRSATAAEAAAQKEGLMAIGFYGKGTLKKKKLEKKGMNFYSLEQ